MLAILSDMILFSSLIIQNWWDPQKTFCLDSSLMFGDLVLVILSLKKMSDEDRKWKQVSPVFITQNLIFSGMFVNSWRLWAPNLTSHRSLSLFFLFFLFFLSFLLFFLSLFFFISSSFCFLPIQYSFFFVLLPPVTHTSTHADPSREIIASIFDHTPKSSTTRSFSSSLLSSASTAFFRSGRSVEIGIHSNDLAGASKSASTATIHSGIVCVKYVLSYFWFCVNMY